MRGSRSVLDAKLLLDLAELLFLELVTSAALISCEKYAQPFFDVLFDVVRHGFNLVQLPVGDFQDYL